MKYYTFYRESNNFDDIVNNQNIRKNIKTMISWSYNLMIGLSDKTEESVLGYIVLKFGDDIINPFEKDYTPIPYKDYIPKKD